MFNFFKTKPDYTKVFLVDFRARKLVSIWIFNNKEETIQKIDR